MSEQEDRVARAFDAAFSRYCGAGSFEGQEDEASNMLHHLYRLRSLRPDDFDVPSIGNGDLVAALLWVRNRDTHRLVKIADHGDLVSNFMTNLFGGLVWAERSSFAASATAPSATKYDSVATGRPVLDTLRLAFDSLREAA